MTLDTRTMTTRILALRKIRIVQPAAKIGDEIALSYSSPVCGFVPEISVVQMKGRAGYILIDVREQEEWEQGHIDGARLWPLSKIMQGVFPDLPQVQKLFCIARRGCVPCKPHKYSRIRVYGCGQSVRRL
jgi:hypothetical protein